MDDERKLLGRLILHPSGSLNGKGRSKTCQAVLYQTVCRAALEPETFTVVSGSVVHQPIKLCQSHLKIFQVEGFHHCGYDALVERSLSFIVSKC